MQKPEQNSILKKKKDSKKIRRLKKNKDENVLKKNNFVPKKYGVTQKNKKDSKK